MPADPGGRSGTWRSGRGTATRGTTPAPGARSAPSRFARAAAGGAPRPSRPPHGEENPDPYAIYGYEAARLALDAIERSGTGNKEDIVKALFETKDRESVLGTYSIDENGDTTLSDYGVYRVKGGELEFDRTIQAQGG